MKIKTIFLLLLINIVLVVKAFAGMLVPMDEAQANHLKAYGLAFHALQRGMTVLWLLNYRGGSFFINNEDSELSEWALTRNVTIEHHTDFAPIQKEIDTHNMNKVELTKAPHIAVYAPPENMPWDDAVTLVLKYAEIPYTRIWDNEVLAGQLTTEHFDWLHLHHEDFTGQYGKFWFAFHGQAWYMERVARYKKFAKEHGFQSEEEEKAAVAMKIRNYVEKGGFLFAMCSGTDTLDIALAAVGLDIIPSEIDGTPMTANAQARLNFKNTLAFENFHLENSPYIYEFSDIDIDPRKENLFYHPFYFKLKDFAAKYDVIPSMLVQDHKNLIKGFLGQTTGFHLNTIKKDVTILDEVEGRDWVTYIHGDRGKGTFTFLAGHDPEDYIHQVGDPPTNLDLFPHSPGYRLILNNVLFPAAKVKKRKT